LSKIYNEITWCVFLISKLVIFYDDLGTLYKHEVLHMGDTLTFNDIPHSITSGFINLQITHEPTKSLGIKTE